MDIGTVQPIDIDQEMRSAYIDYAMSGNCGPCFTGCT